MSENRSPTPDAKALFRKWVPWVILVAVVGGGIYALSGCALLEPTAAEKAAAEAGAIAGDSETNIVETIARSVIPPQLAWAAPLLLLLFKRVRENLGNVGSKTLALGKAVAAIPGLVHTDDAKKGES